MRYSLSYIPVRVCLGYLRGRSFPPKIQLSLAISEKSSRRDEISAHEVSIPCRRTLDDKEHGLFLLKHYCNICQNCVSKCTRLHLSAYSFQNMAGGGGMPRDPPRKLVAFGHSERLLQTINPRQNTAAGPSSRHQVPCLTYQLPISPAFNHLFIHCLEWVAIAE